MTDAVPSAEWADSIFSSAEIEELSHRFQVTIDDIENQMPLVLWFERQKALEFIHAVQMAPSHPVYAARLMSMLQYMSRTLANRIQHEPD